MANKESHGRPREKNITYGSHVSHSLHPEMKQYYERKTAEGKHALSVINAVKNKLVLRAVAVIKSQAPYVDNFVKSEQIIKNAS